MAQSITELYNLALSAAGTRARISLPDERSREAEICNLWYPSVYRQVLRAAPWSSARAYQRLALFAEVGDQWEPGAPEPGFRFAYSLPDKCLRPVYLYGYSRFSVGLINPTLQALMTNEPDPVLYYTHEQVEVSLWDSQLYLAIAHALAANIALPLNGRTQQARAAIAQANMLIAQAQETAANEIFAPVETSPSWLQVRGSSFDNSVSPYVYPNGPMISVANV